MFRQREVVYAVLTLMEIWSRFRACRSGEPMNGIARTASVPCTETSEPMPAGKVRAFQFLHDEPSPCS